MSQLATQTGFVELAFPLGGVDQSRARSAQKSGTCLTATNVRGFSPFGDRYSGGKRAGMKRTYSTKATATDNRVVALGALTSAAGNPGDGNFSEADQKILVLNDGGVWVGDLPGVGSLGTLSAGTATASFPTGSIPSITDFAGKWYVVDGDVERIIDNAGVCTAWAATAGTVPSDCAYAATFRGSIYLARSDAGGNNDWYKSRLADPLDYDFGAEPVSTSAVSGVTGDAGRPDDIITGLIPSGDDWMILGCASSMWWIEGDPAAGGRVLNLSRKTGLISHRAWCFDENNDLYFVGNGGLYKITNLEGRPGKPVNVDRRRLYSDFNRLDTTSTLVQLAYDHYAKHVHIFLTPTDGTTGPKHVVYDVDADAFWFDRYPTVEGNAGPIGPWSVVEITGPDEQDRRFLLGGDDGYVRRPSDVAFGDDDGSATPVLQNITCSVRFGPIAIDGGRVESLVTELVIVGAEGEVPFSNADVGPVTWLWFTADSPSELAKLETLAAVATGTVFSSGTGAQEAIGLRQAGAAHELRLRQVSSTKTFAIESVHARLIATARRRQ